MIQRMHLLYDNADVTAEWEVFLEYVLRDAALETASKAVVASQSQWGFAKRSVRLGAQR